MIERIEDFPCEASLVTEMIRINKNTLLGWVKELDLPQPIKLKDVIARIKIFDVGTQKVWLNEILDELGSDYGTLKYKAGYEQGKLEGEWVGQQLKDADKIRQELNKPVVPQFVADWIEYCKENHLTITGAFEPVSEHGIGLAETFKGSAYKCTRWALDNQNLLARAWLDGYEVEKEKRYLVKMKNLRALFCYLAYIPDEGYWTLMASGGKSIVIKHTRKELEEAGFGWVFDCPGIEIEEVTE